MSESAADRFHWKAAECRKSAEQADDPIDKEAWLELASEWLKLAEDTALRHLRDSGRADWKQ
jgi:hypothetical protein